MELLHEIVNAFIEMAPYLVFGFLFAGLLHVVINQKAVLKHLGKNNLWSVIKASLFGVPLPLCSCSVIPTAISLKKSNASNASVMSFLISTPLTGVDSIVATYGVLGPVFAVFRPIVAFFAGIAGGIAALVVNTEKPDEKTPLEAPSCGCSGDDSEGEQKENDTGCCGGAEVSTQNDEASCCGEMKPATPEKSCCGGSSEVPLAPIKKSLISRVYAAGVEIWNYAFKTLLDDIVVPLVIGIVISGVISWLLPDDYFSGLDLPNYLQMVIMIVVGVPIYICATASLPIGAALLAKGLSPGVIFVFLAAGPVTNSATIVLIIKQFGKKFFFVYFTVIAVCSILSGLLLDWIVNGYGLTIQPALYEHEGHGVSVIAVAVSILFFVIVLNSLKRKFFPQKGKTPSCCSS